MKAILVKEPGGADQLYLTEIDVPLVREHEVLIQVKATALNRMDIIQREGRYPVPKDASSILGVDVAGVVAGVGSSVSKWKKGDEVFGLLQGGAYAEFATSHQDLLWKKPQNLSFEEAAALPEVFMTAYQTLFRVGEGLKGESVLIHAGASGVGTAAIQLAKQKGLTSYVTAGSDEKISFCESLGATKGFNYKDGDFFESLMNTTAGHGVDVILDFVGAPYWQSNLKALKKSGRLVVIGYMGGVKVSETDLGLILRNWLEIKGTTLRARSHEYRAHLAAEVGAYCLPRFEDGRLKPILYKCFDWAEVKKAHELMEANANVGKIVLQVSA